MNRFVAVVAFIAFLSAGCGVDRQSDDVLAADTTAATTQADDEVGGDVDDEVDAGDGDQTGDSGDGEPAVTTTVAPFVPPTTGAPEAVALSVDFGDSTWELTHGELNEIVVKTQQDEDFVNLVFRGVPPADFTQTVLNELLYAQATEAELAAEGGEIPEETLGLVRTALLGQVSQLFVASPDPAADAEALYEAAPYLPFLVRFQAAQDALIAVIAETAGPTEIPCVSHILVEAETEATDIVARLDGGEDFAALAIELSIGPSGPGGGVLGCGASSGYVPPFAAAVDTATVGEVVGPVQTDFGWHVIVVTGTEEGPPDPPGIASTRLRDRVLGATVEIDEKLGTWDPDALAILPPGL